MEIIILFIIIVGFPGFVVCYPVHLLHNPGNHYFFQGPMAQFGNLKPFSQQQRFNRDQLYEIVMIRLANPVNIVSISHDGGGWLYMIL